LHKNDSVYNLFYLQQENGELVTSPCKMSDFIWGGVNHILTSNDNRNISQDYISGKSLQWEPRWSVRADGQTDRH